MALLKKTDPFNVGLGKFTRLDREEGRAFQMIVRDNGSKKNPEPITRCVECRRKSSTPLCPKCRTEIDNLR